MPNPVVFDRQGRKYELHPAVFIERGLRGRYGKGFYAIPRSTFHMAFFQSLIIIQVLGNSLQPCAYQFLPGFGNRGWLQIGCRIFNKTNATKIRKWAERLGK